MKHTKETIRLLEHSQYYYTIVVDMDSVYSYVSPSYDKNFRMLTDTLLGQSFYVTLHPDDVEICKNVGAKCFEHPDHLQTAILRKHDGRGGYVSTQWELKALFDDDNAPAGILCVGHNITEYVHTRNQLKNAATQIVKKNDQLDQISYMQAHIIRKPLANILGLANVLEELEIEPELKI